MYFHTKHVGPPPPSHHRLHPTIKGESAKSVFGNINRAGVACGEGAILCDRGGAVTCVACRHAQTRDTRHGQTDRHSAGALIATCRPRSSPRGGSPVSILSHQLILTLHCWRNQLIFVYRLGAHGTSINITSKWSALLTSAFGCYGSVLTGF